MIKVLTALACTCAAMAFTGTAGATVRFGVNESAGKGADRGIGFFGTLNNIGLTENAVTLSWNAAAPQQIVGKPDLDLWMPQAAIRGIRVVLVVSPARPKDLTSAPDNAAKFASFLQLVARTYPQVKDFVVGNEPNQPKFWQPQFDENGQNVSGAAYEQVLAQSYDALKAVDPKINVIGLGLSARGNDMPNAPSNISTSPIRFLYYLGKAYRASGRTKPLMDELAFHPYPNVNTDAPLKGYQWPNAGIPNLDRVKQVIWDAFNGTGQPVFAESGLRQAHPLKLDLDETGWQVGIPPNLAVLYHGKENVPVIDESTQAQYYGDIVRYIVCDPDVVSLSFYHLIDESDLDRWQSGLLRLDGSHRPSYDSVKAAIAQTQGRCAGAPVAFRHITTVVGARATFPKARKPLSAKWKRWNLLAAAQEGALYRAGIFRLGSARLSPKARKAILRALAAGRFKPVLATKGKIRQNVPRVVKFPSRRLKRGWYVYGVRISAETNSARANSFVSRPFRVGALRKRK